MTSDDDKCKYPDCSHMLGPWVPSEVKHEKFSDFLERTCEKCGGKQIQCRPADPQLIADTETLFEAFGERMSEAIPSDLTIDSLKEITDRDRTIKKLVTALEEIEDGEIFLKDNCHCGTSQTAQKFATATLEEFRTGIKAFSIHRRLP